MRQGFVLTQYFYEQMLQFEHDPASLKDTIGEMVYSMDVDQQVHRIRDLEFDKEADAEVLERSKPKKVTGMDLAEVKLASGDMAGASQMAQQVLNHQSDTIASAAESAHAYFIMARVSAMTGHPEQAIDDFQKTPCHQQGTTRAGLVAYLSGPHARSRLQARSGTLRVQTCADGARRTERTRGLAAERGVKSAYSVNGHTCDEDADEGTSGPVLPARPATGIE